MALWRREAQGIWGFAIGIGTGTGTGMVRQGWYGWTRTEQAVEPEQPDKAEVAEHLVECLLAEDACRGELAIPSESTSQHPISMGIKSSRTHGTCGVA